MERTTPRKIEFGFFDAGGGHRAAATALQQVIQSQQRPWDVRLVNLQELMEEIDIAKKYAGIRIEDIYNRMLRNGWTLGSPQLLKVLQFAIRTNHKRTVNLLERHWRASEPDMVVSFVPHFNRAMCEALGNARPGVPFVTVITDIANYPPKFWIERQRQYIVCGSDKAMEQARGEGYREDELFRASGMILNPKFYDAPAVDRAAERVALGLRANMPTALVMFGGYGSKAMLEIAERLDASELDLQLILVCGRNEKLAAALRGRRWRIPHFVEGFTTKVNAYMQAADFFIGKPGPGSVSEALAMHLPVIVECNAWTLPQERYNAEWVLENRVGFVLPSFKEIVPAAAKLIEPETLQQCRANAAAMKNRAVFEIPEFLDGIFQRLAGAEGRAARPASEGLQAVSKV
jgi:UDP-N-acetylglucosamine:LPS N-acetylglucosamine transferase